MTLMITGILAVAFIAQPSGEVQATIYCSATDGSVCARAGGGPECDDVALSNHFRLEIDERLQIFACIVGERVSCTEQQVHYVTSTSQTLTVVLQAEGSETLRFFEYIHQGDDFDRYKAGDFRAMSSGVTSVGTCNEAAFVDRGLDLY